MTDILLAKPKVPSGFIDCTAGEPRLLRKLYSSIFSADPHNYQLYLKPDDLEYPHPAGYEPLVSFLESKYKGRVIVTNGAKQGLAAVFYALNHKGYKNVSMISPHWALIPPLAKIHSLDSEFVNSEDDEFTGPFLALSPNNPDNRLLDLEKLAKRCKKKNLPLIHDAAYYTNSYVQGSLPTFGDVQVYSISKMFGFSGLRVGFIVCNDDFYHQILSYVEAMTVGVSIPAQHMTLHMLERMNHFPTLAQSFHNNTYEALKENKILLSQIHPDVLEVPKSFDTSTGMFGWFKKGKLFNQELSKVMVVDGINFGSDAHIRMNICLKKEVIEEVVKRFNSLV